MIQAIPQRRKLKKKVFKRLVRLGMWENIERILGCELKLIMLKSGTRTLDYRSLPEDFQVTINGGGPCSAGEMLYDLQGGICYYCQKKTTKKEWSIDHKLPRSRGGKNNHENLCGSCKACNNAKGAMTEKEFRESMAIQGIGGGVS